MNKFYVIVVLVVLLNQVGATAIISFFEEFPNEDTLEKVRQLDFDTKIYMAAKSLPDFYALKESYQSANERVIEVIYWPVLEKEEGYWISPWADKQALERIFNEIKERPDGEHLEVMLDLELPLERSTLLNLGNFLGNKKLISNFIRNSSDHNISVITVESLWMPEWFMKLIGLAYNSEVYGNRRIKMFYSSFSRARLPDSHVDQAFKKAINLFETDDIIPALGCIDVGINGNEPINSPEVLDKELRLISGKDIEEVVIFRLSGLNEEYSKVIKKYS